jgi:hypothetical protein
MAATLSRAGTAVPIERPLDWVSVYSGCAHARKRGF